MKQDKKHHAPWKKKKVKKNEFCKGRHRLKKKTKLQMQDLLQILDWEFTQRMDKFEQQETAVVQKEQRGADRATEGGGEERKEQRCKKRAIVSEKPGARRVAAELPVPLRSVAFGVVGPAPGDARDLHPGARRPDPSRNSQPRL